MHLTQVMNNIWAWLAQKKAARLALGLVMVLQVAAFALPQIPVPSSERASYNRWLAEFRPLLGNTVTPLAAVGFLTLRTSYVWRLTLGFVALIVVAHGDSLRADHEQPEPPPGRAISWMLALGGLLIIAGWTGQMVWGWREPDVTAWPGAVITTPERGLSVAQPQGAIGIWPGQYGLYVIRRGARVGLQIQATDQEGDPYLLLPSVGEEPQETLRVDFSWQAPETFFAVPAANLIFRLNQFEEQISVQAYRSASGELLAEVTIQTGEPQMVTIGEVAIDFTQFALPRYEVVYNPGALVEGVGTLLFVAGVVAPAPAAEAERAELTEAEEGES